MTAPRWSGPLALAGALAAGLVAGRAGKVLLATGVLAAAGWRCVSRKPCEMICEDGMRAGDDPEIEPEDEPAESPTEGPVANAAPPELSAPDVEVPRETRAEPVIWQAGEGTAVSCGAQGAETVWFGLREPVRAIVARVVPASGPGTAAPGGACAAPLAMALPQSLFVEEPGAKPAERAGSAPAPAIAAAPPSGVALAPPAVAGAAAPVFAEAMKAGPVVVATEPVRPAALVTPAPATGTGLAPQPAPGGVVGPARVRSRTDGGWGRWMAGLGRAMAPAGSEPARLVWRWGLRAAATVLAIFLVALVMGLSQSAGWFQELQHRWAVARGKVPAHTAPAGADRAGAAMPGND